jgi:hypothetical protein
MQIAWSNTGNDRNDDGIFPSTALAPAGFMMMFSGAVSLAQKPACPRFVHDDPERILEFIAFVSLLAKLLNQAKKGRST